MRVGTQCDGLRPINAIRLYTSKLRPLLEFGSQILVFSDAQISKLEKLQGQALRRMLGFHQGVKYETVLAISGLTKMKYRFMQLQLQFWNRVKHVLDPNLYVSKIFMHKLTLARTRGVQPGFCAHLPSWPLN